MHSQINNFFFFLKKETLLSNSSCDVSGWLQAWLTINPGSGLP